MFDCEEKEASLDPILKNSHDNYYLITVFRFMFTSLNCRNTEKRTVIWNVIYETIKEIFNQFTTGILLKEVADTEPAKVIYIGETFVTRATVRILNDICM